MKLHNILYTLGFICLFTGVAAIDDWMCGRTSLITPVILILLAAVTWYRGLKEDGRIGRKG